MVGLTWPLYWAYQATIGLLILNIAALSGNDRGHTESRRDWKQGEVA